MQIRQLVRLVAKFESERAEDKENQYKLTRVSHIPLTMNLVSEPETA